MHILWHVSRFSTIYSYDRQTDLPTDIATAALYMKRRAVKTKERRMRCAY